MSKLESKSNLHISNVTYHTKHENNISYCYKIERKVSSTNSVTVPSKDKVDDDKCGSMSYDVECCMCGDNLTDVMCSDCRAQLMD